MLQDIVIAICCGTFCIAMTQQVLGLLKLKSARQFTWFNCISTAAAIWITVWAFASKGMIMTALVNVYQSLAWTTIVAMKIIWDRKAPTDVAHTMSFDEAEGIISSTMMMRLSKYNGKPLNMNDIDTIVFSLQCDLSSKIRYTVTCSERHMDSSRVMICVYVIMNETLQKYGFSVPVDGTNLQIQVKEGIGQGIINPKAIR
jgi:hypothetical protein